MNNERDSTPIEIPLPRRDGTGNRYRFFSQVNPKGQIVKISPTFPERVIDTVCYTAQMYKVEIRDYTDGTRGIGFVVAINRLIKEGDRDPFIARLL